MDYKEALQYIHGTYKFGSKLGLENIQDLLSRLGSPHKQFPAIHVGGTNGKGSVVSMIASILSQGGYRVGMFISPYLEQFTERIQINQKEISREDLARITSMVKEKVDEMVGEGKNHPTEFEIVTAIGFTYFAQQKVDIAVIEVGLGGRLDATNVLDPLASVITLIDYDHMDILGSTLEKIAFEKAGIIKEGKPVISYPQSPEAQKVLKKAAKERHAPLTQVSPDQIAVHSSEFCQQIFDFKFQGTQLCNLMLHLSGRHQLMNAATALTAVMVLRQQGIKIAANAFYEGLSRAAWPGRLELFGKHPYVVLDGAHNASGARMMASAIREYFQGRRINLVLGILADKEVDAIINTICPLVHSVVVTRPDSPRAVDPAELAQKIAPICSRVSVVPDITKAVDQGLALTGSDDVLLISGSLYLIGRARSHIKALNPESKITNNFLKQ